VYKSFSFSTSSPILVIFCFISVGWPNGHMVMSHCDFNLYQKYLNASTVSIACLREVSLIVFAFVSAVLEMEPRALCVVGKHSATELH
jgi:hypothetical protein